MDKIQVTERALVQRINRLLGKERQKLMKTRGDRLRSNLGDWYVVDAATDTVTAQHTLEGLGREVGALKPHECLEDRGQGVVGLGRAR